MAQSKRSRADEQLLLALACGATVEGAAQKAGVSARTVHRRLEQPGFRQRMEAVRAEILGRTAATMAAASGEALKTLMLLQSPEHPGSVRLGASRAVLEIGMKLRERTEVERRLAALEEQLHTTRPAKGRSRA